MTKNELIERLQKIEGNLIVKIYDSEQEFLYGIGDIEEDWDYSKVPTEKVIVIS